MVLGRLKTSRYWN